MYRNFKLTEEERQQILESHKKHGYGKPLKEQEETNDGYDMEETIFFSTQQFSLQVYTPEGDEVMVKVTKGDDEGVSFEIAESFSDDLNEEEVINFVKDKYYNSELFQGLPDGILFNLETKKLSM